MYTFLWVWQGFSIYTLYSKCHHQFGLMDCNYYTNASAMQYIMNYMKLVLPLYSLYWSIHTKDESKRGTAFAFIFGVN